MSPRHAACMLQEVLMQVRERAARLCMPTATLCIRLRRSPMVEQSQPVPVVALDVRSLTQWETANAQKDAEPARRRARLVPGHEGLGAPSRCRFRSNRRLRRDVSEEDGLSALPASGDLRRNLLQEGECDVVGTLSVGSRSTSPSPSFCLAGVVQGQAHHKPHCPPCTCSLGSIY